jgi:hypothetical protein
MAKQGGAYPPLRGASGPKQVAKAFRGPTGFKESQALQKKLKLPKKKWTKADEAFVIGSGIGIASTELFGTKKRAKKTMEKIKKLTTKEAVGTGDIGNVRSRRAGGGNALRGLGRAFMKGGKA